MVSFPVLWTISESTAIKSFLFEGNFKVVSVLFNSIVFLPVYGLASTLSILNFTPLLFKRAKLSPVTINLTPVS